jgi:hypothetical protein
MDAASTTATAPLWAAAKEALALLTDKVESGKIRIRDDTLTTIKRRERLLGELDVFVGSFTVYHRLPRAVINRIYPKVFCVEKDVLRVEEGVLKRLPPDAPAAGTAPTPDAEAGPEELPPPPVTRPAELAVTWMLNQANAYAAKGSIGKRGTMISACTTVTGCTKRDAEAAHKSLPDHLKRRRGKPRKNSG